MSLFKRDCPVGFDQPESGTIANVWAKSSTTMCWKNKNIDLKSSFELVQNLKYKNSFTSFILENSSKEIGLYFVRMQTGLQKLLGPHIWRTGGGLPKEFEGRLAHHFFGIFFHQRTVRRQIEERFQYKKSKKRS